MLLALPPPLHRRLAAGDEDFEEIIDPLTEGPEHVPLGRPGHLLAGGIPVQPSMEYFH